MDLGLGGRTAVISGGSKGIGKACAEALAAEGCHLHLISRDEASLAKAAAELRSQYGVDVVFTSADLSVAGSGAAVVDALGETVDILVNCAGAAPPGALVDLSPEDWRRAWDLKVYGYIDMTRAALRHMYARRRGVVVNIIGGGVINRSDNACGTSGNAALSALTNSAGAHAADFGCRVVGVHPGAALTDRLEKLMRRQAEAKLGDAERWRELLSNHPFGRPADPREIGDLVAFLASDRAAYITGESVRIDGGKPHHFAAGA
jgi:NAD(P)-dependent dehydrogenase (short-subunit alcohol dehydrogenase family)